MPHLRGPGPTTYRAALAVPLVVGVAAFALGGLLVLREGREGREGRVPGGGPAWSESEGPVRVGRTVELTGGPGTAAKARSVARAFLARLGPAAQPLVDAAELVVSELVTNAIRHGPGPCVLDLEHTGPELRVSVHDAGSARPSLQPRQPERPAGHGLELVRALCARMSITSSHEGNVVTAWLTVPTAPV